MIAIHARKCLVAFQPINRSGTGDSVVVPETGLEPVADVDDELVYDCVAHGFVEAFQSADVHE